MNRIPTTRFAPRSALAVLLVVGAGCDSRDTQTETRSTQAQSNIDAWLGQWNGPEGTYLKLTKRDANFIVEIKSLDGAETYVGSERGDRLEFQRNGETETIRATDGKSTGMKWLLDKRDCLTINVGEGFCRD